MSQLSPAAQEALNRYREQTGYATSQRDALWSRLEDSIDAGADETLVAELDYEQELEEYETTEQPESWKRSAFWAGVGAAAACLLLTVGLSVAPQFATAVGDTSHSSAAYDSHVERERHSALRTAAKQARAAATRAPKPTVVPEHTASLVPTAVPPLAEVEAQPATPPLAVAPRRRVTAKPRVTSPVPGIEAAPETPAKPVSTLADELRLMQRCRTAIRNSQPGEALALLQQHAALFPEGQLREDRQALRAIALCRGERPEGDEAAERFFTAFPRSHHRRAIVAACRAPQ